MLKTSKPEAVEAVQDADAAEPCRAKLVAQPAGEHVADGAAIVEQGAGHERAPTRAHAATPAT